MTTRWSWPVPYERVHFKATQKRYLENNWEFFFGNRFSTSSITSTLVSQGHISEICLEYSWMFVIFCHNCMIDNLSRTNTEIKNEKKKFVVVNLQFSLGQDSTGIFIRNQMCSNLECDFVNVKFVTNQMSKCSNKTFIFHQDLRWLFFNDQTSFDQGTKETDIRWFHIWKWILTISNWNWLP